VPFATGGNNRDALVNSKLFEYVTPPVALTGSFHPWQFGVLEEGIASHIPYQEGGFLK
jgi:hypothetical protein